MGQNITLRKVTITIDEVVLGDIQQAPESGPVTSTRYVPTPPPLEVWRFRVDDEINGDTHWFKEAQGREVILTNNHPDGLVDGFFVSDRFPFAAINPKRLERVP
jgi:hypothetical protein